MTAALLGPLCFASSALEATGQATSDALVVRVVAEVESKTGDGRGPPRMAPAERVVPGDLVFYTLEIRNAGAEPLRSPVVIHAVPAHMRYVADSAVGPGADISFSIDGGRVFEPPEKLHVVAGDGRIRGSRADEYTHIRWKLRHVLEPNSVAFARFRAVVR